MRDYYRRVLLDRWDDLIEVSPDAQRVYHYTMTGPNSTAYGITLAHLGRLRRDLALTEVGVHAAIVELVQAEILVASEISGRLMVVVDSALACVLAPRDPNNHIAAVKRTSHIPSCSARSAWTNCLKFSVAQLPESTGSRGPSPSQALPKGCPSKNKNENEKENLISNPSGSQVRKRFSDQEKALILVWTKLVAEPHGLPVPATTVTGLALNKVLRKKVRSFVRREPGRDLDVYFDRVSCMIRPFHLGENKDGWVAHLAWAIKSDTEAKAASVGSVKRNRPEDVDAEIAAALAIHAEKNGGN